MIMSTAIAIFFLIIGILLLVKGADLFVTKAARLGNALRIHPIIVGILVIAVGTSLPELVVSVLAAVQGQPLIAASNVIGSNITNIGLIVGLSAMLGNITLQKKSVMRDIPLSILPVLVLVLLWLLNIPITPVISMLLIAGYLVFAFYSSKEYPKQQNLEKTEFTLLDGVLLVFGLIVLLAGGELTLRYAEMLFTSLGVSEIIVGAVILALGTSLPELVTVLTAVLKKDGQLALGGVLGSNVFNILGVFGVSTLISSVNLVVLQVELVYLLVISILFVVISLIGKKLAISKFEGAVLFLVYVSYVVAVITLG